MTYIIDKWNDPFMDDYWREYYLPADEWYWFSYLKFSGLQKEFLREKHKDSVIKMNSELCQFTR